MEKGFHERIKSMQEGREIIEERIDGEGGGGTSLRPGAETLPSTEFVKVEKNLASLGFFTPSSKRLRNAQEKTFTITTVAEGKRLELRGTIIPSAKYGLPITADQDKWIALCKILTDVMRKEGRVTNPVSFSSAEILRLLRKHRHSGKNYREIEEWLDVLFSTTIFSEGVVYLANEKRRVKDRYRVFDRAVSFGKELPDGKVADKNYVWFSDWQLQNINSNHLLPIDLEAYRSLRNHISKALVPLLQIWLYTTRDQGVFEKRYDELCRMLNIQQYRYESLIVRTLSPSLNELKQVGYLAEWRIEETSDRDGYKILFFHGEKFHRDRRTRLKRNPTETTSALSSEHDAPKEAARVIARGAVVPPTTNSEPASGRKVNDDFLAELMKRGVTENHARKILADVTPNQPVIAQLEWGDLQVKQSGGKILNPAGFYVSLVSGNVTPPQSFETAAEKKAREAKERQAEDERQAQEDLETEYYWYREREIDRYVASLDPAQVEAVFGAKRQAYREKHPNLSAEITDGFANREAKNELGKTAPLITIEEFKATLYQQIIAAPLKPVEDVEEEELLMASPFASAVPYPEPGVPEKEASTTAPDVSADATPPPSPPAGETPISRALLLPTEPIILLADEPPRADPDADSLSPETA